MASNISTSHSNQYGNLALSQTFQRIDEALIQVSDELGGTLTRDPSLSGDLLDDIIDNKYRLLCKIGEGGMGSVYKVRHLLLNKEVALKTFRHNNLSAVAWQRFQREAQTIARLHHNNIVQVFDFGIAEANAPYYTMELLKGESLADCLVRCRRLTVSQAISTFAAVAAALSHAHNLGVVHRDIKPGNIFLDYSQNGKVVIKVVDFGLAKLATAASSATSQRETDNGLVFGSPLYMSPEQADGRAIDQRTDIYSFGCAFFEALTGSAPFVGDNAFATIQKHIFAPIPLLAEHCPEGQFSEELDTFLGKVMAKDRLERYQNFDDLLVDLRHVYEQKEGRSARISRNNLEAIVVAADGQKTQVNDAQDSPAESTSTGGKQSRYDQIFKKAGPRVLPKFDVAMLVLIGWAAVVIAALFMLFGENGLGTELDPGHQSSITSLPSATAVVAPPKAVPTVGEKGQYYLAAVDDKGRRQFKFPYGVKLGYLSWANHKPVAATGDVVVPAQAQLNLYIGDELIAHPELLRGFHPDDIYGVVCGGQDNLDDKIFESIAVNLSKLSHLDCNHAEFSCKYAPHLNKLKDLRLLELNDSNIDGLDLAEYTGLTNLFSLDAGQISHVSEVLEKMKGSRNIAMLGFAGCIVSDQDLAVIAGFPNLRQVNLRASDVSAAGIAPLTAMPALNWLMITPRQYSHELIECLKKFPHLQYLTIDDENWTADQRAQLKKVMGVTAIIHGESGAAHINDP